ncbi:GNAT family N-acetyltransferase [uncultured Draconibacterium sp.]|uniref:GNAT family N-acetyltransferase n=1 Tax=uncultured Draconibacterium sp. TaxID=1573823 RepID=UPI0029C5FEC1|nr:GNAT family N-acetyltransferase [uncultured Draconibacterium sp.]
MNYTIREANISDIKFLSKVIIESEKSGTDKIGLANIFNMKEIELQTYLVKMLEEEIEGCEFSISSYVVTEYKGKPVAAFGGWIEKENEDEQPSSVLKSNLISFIFPKDKLIAFKKNYNVLKDIFIEREAHTHQIEYVYVDEKHRGNRLASLMIEELIRIAKTRNPNVKKSQAQCFESNEASIRLNEHSGYKKVIRQESQNPDILRFLPCNVKLMMERNI